MQNSIIKQNTTITIVTVSKLKRVTKRFQTERNGIQVTRVTDFQAKARAKKIKIKIKVFFSYILNGFFLIKKKSGKKWDSCVIFITSFMVLYNKLVFN